MYVRTGSRFGLRRWRLAGVAAGVAAAVLVGGTALAATRGLGEPGPQAPGRTLLINDRTITPAGRQTTLGDLPVKAVLSPDGAHMLVVNSGAGIQSLQVVATDSSQIVQTIQYFVPDSVFVGAAYSPDGTAAYVSGGGFDVVHTFSVASDGQLTKTGDIPVGTLKQNPYPTGLGVSPDGSTLAVANNLANTVDLIDLKSRQISATIPVGHFPYGAIFSRDGKKVFVSNWDDATLSVVDVASHAVTGTVKVGRHPNEMILGTGSQLFVSDANSDAVSIVDTQRDREVRRVSVSPTRGAALGSSPEGLSLSADGRRLFVADAGADEVTVIQLAGEDQEGENEGGSGARVLGRIPTAWYPTSVAVSKDGRQLFVTNAKGTGAGPNNKGFFPDPTRTNVPFQDGIAGNNDRYCNCTFDQYTATMIAGTLSTVAVPSQQRLEIYTDQVARNNHFGDQSINQRSPGNPIPRPGGTSPIKHVIYIIKENRTYDQVFGDLKQGDGSPDLTLFGAANTPNLHALAQRFGILDNFYADAEVSADGHNWATSANASDYNEKMYPQVYSPAVGRNRPYDFEGTTTVNLSAGGYLWDAAAQSKVSLRDYGEFANNAPLSTATLIPDGQACPGPTSRSYIGVTIPAGQVLCFQPTTINATTTPNLVGTEDPNFRSYDLRYSEAERVQEWAREFAQFEQQRSLPQLEIMRLPNDHTAGTAPGRPTPQQYVAENDAAVGKVVDVVSHSRDWGSTAIFVTEDDAQNGPDHVDSHRTTSLVVSPFTQRSSARVDHTLYDTSAMVRTMELILGMKPLSQFDANAVPMWRLFQARPDLRPFSVLPEGGAGTAAMNTEQSFGAAQSASLNFDTEDRAPSDELNQIIWGSVKGPDTPFPAQFASTDAAATADP